MRETSIKIVNTELGIASYSGNQITGDIHNLSTLIFFYNQKRDWIVFNELHPDYELLLELVQVYMELDDLQRKVFIEYIHNPEVRKMINILNRILRIRRKRYQKMSTA